MQFLPFWVYQFDKRNKQVNKQNSCAWPERPIIKPQPEARDQGVLRCDQTSASKM